MIKLSQLMLICFLLFSVNRSIAQSEQFFDRYHTSEEVQDYLNVLSKENQEKIKVHDIAKSPGDLPVTVLEIGSDKTDCPAIFVGANFEGNIPIATEGAMFLANMLMDSAAYTENIKWFILPLPNPDAAEGFFAKMGIRYVVHDRDPVRVLD